jgi:hypothetical protein
MRAKVLLEARLSIAIKRAMRAIVLLVVAQRAKVLLECALSAVKSTASGRARLCAKRNLVFALKSIVGRRARSYRARSERKLVGKSSSSRHSNFEKYRFC